MLAELLLRRYAVREKLIGRDYATGELTEAEYALTAVHEAITNHRSRCPQCKMHEYKMHESKMHESNMQENAKANAIARRKPLRSQVPVPPISMAS
jgi:hypothetical protein